MSLANNLRYYRKKYGLSQEQIAEKLGYKSFTTIQKWETGVSEPSLEKIAILAEIFNISIETLFTGTEVTTPPQDPIPQYPFIPEGVAAGLPCTIEGIKKLSTIGISDTIMGKYKRNKNIVIMKVNGESMNRIVPNGSFVVVKIDYPVANLKNDDMVVFNHSYEYSLKHFYRSEGRIMFKPCSKNPTFTDIVFDESEEVTIVGKVVMYMVSLE